MYHVSIFLQIKILKDQKIFVFFHLGLMCDYSIGKSFYFLGVTRIFSFAYKNTFLSHELKLVQKVKKKKKKGYKVQY